MKVTNKDAVDCWWGYLSKDELTLRSFAWIEEKALIIPAQKVGAMIAQPCRMLRGAA